MKAIILLCAVTLLSLPSFGYCEDEWNKALKYTNKANDYKQTLLDDLSHAEPKLISMTNSEACKEVEKLRKQTYKAGKRFKKVAEKWEDTSFYCDGQNSVSAMVNQQTYLLEKDRMKLVLQEMTRAQERKLCSSYKIYEID